MTPRPRGIPPSRPSSEQLLAASMDTRSASTTRGAAAARGRSRRASRAMQATAPIATQSDIPQRSALRSPRQMLMWRRCCAGTRCAERGMVDRRSAQRTASHPCLHCSTVPRTATADDPDDAHREAMVVRNAPRQAGREIAARHRRSWPSRTTSARPGRRWFRALRVCTLEELRIAHVGRDQVACANKQNTSALMMRSAPNSAAKAMTIGLEVDARQAFTRLR